jgi:hypothetical protein
MLIPTNSRVFSKRSRYNVYVSDAVKFQHTNLFLYDVDKLMVIIYFFHGDTLFSFNSFLADTL